MFGRKSGNASDGAYYYNMEVGGGINPEGLSAETFFMPMGRRLTRLALLDPELLGGPERARELVMEELRAALASGEVPESWSSMLVQAEIDNLESKK